MQQLGQQLRPRSLALQLLQVWQCCCRCALCMLEVSLLLAVGGCAWLLPNRLGLAGMRSWLPIAVVAGLLGRAAAGSSCQVDEGDIRRRIWGCGRAGPEGRGG